MNALESTSKQEKEALVALQTYPASPVQVLMRTWRIEGLATTRDSGREIHSSSHPADGQDGTKTSCLRQEAPYRVMAVTAARTTAETFDVSRDHEIEACTSAASLFKLGREVTRRGWGGALFKKRARLPHVPMC